MPDRGILAQAFGVVGRRVGVVLLLVAWRAIATSARPGRRCEAAGVAAGLCAALVVLVALWALGVGSARAAATSWLVERAGGRAGSDLGRAGT